MALPIEINPPVLGSSPKGSLRASRLIDLCTPSISYDSQVKSASIAFDRQMYEIIDDTHGYATPVIGDQLQMPGKQGILFIPSIMDLQDENLVNILAWQFNVDGYDVSKPLEFRKQLVQESIVWHKTKGTYALVQHVLDVYWPGGATIAEWFDYKDPFPPNYPNTGTDVLATSFAPANVIVASELFSIVSHGLTNLQQIRFSLGQAGNVLPAIQRRPGVTELLDPSLLYYVVFVDLDSFKISGYANGQPLNLINGGVGTNNIYKKTGDSWHDRYRFRIIVDQNIILPADELEVLELIDRYKPVSRWCEGIFRPKLSDGYIGWAGVCLRFIMRVSELPSNREQAEGYHLAPPEVTSGPVLVYSDVFTVSLPTLSTVDAIVTVTPSDGEGGTFTPATAKLSNANPVANFVYKPSSAGSKVITFSNDGGLTDPAPVTFVAKITAATYTLVGPASGYEGSASTAFTVALPTNTVSPLVTVTPSDGGNGGTFVPASMILSATLLRKSSETPSATFVYTPATVGTKVISCTNDGGLTDPPALNYAVTEFTPLAVADLAHWSNGDTIQTPTAYNIWDASPAARHWAAWLVYATQVAGPNGHNAIRFTGEGYGGYINQALWLTGPYTVFLVVKHDTVPAALGMWFSLGSFGTPMARVYVNGTDFIYEHMGVSLTDVGGIVAGQWNILTAQWDGTNMRFWRNGILKGTTPQATVLGPQEPRYSLGYDSPAGNYYFIAGDLADEATVARAMPDSERQSLEGYFKRRYAIP